MALPITFEQFQKNNAPYWARINGGDSFHGALGQKKDELIAIAKQGVKARMPLLAPVDALATIGAERGLPRYAADTDDSYRLRLQDAWALWYWGGTPKGVLDELARAFSPYTGWRIVTNKGRVWKRSSLGVISYTDVPALAGWDPRWNTFQVWAVPPLPVAWTPTPPANGSAEANTAADIVRRWKSGHSECLRITVVASFGFIWGYPGDDDTHPGPILWGEASLDWGDPAVFAQWTP